ncbi:hypothetical protein JAAARDRAFT_607869 [Jaapia argillacea MUCL 33604]|uniref:Uncharacterized protein n=1 Tax=Jaapia argillacea MUCL 33604 TaxID=933084 RepID=A0A067Q0A1_9AGAM|nr:hypothetical protein JAAARDRAFT_607869 [Jaapia argillacea MUCL 33604]
MPKDRINAICLEFEDPTDLAQFLSSNLIDDDIDSDHSVVDQPGPGRTVDKLITKAGRKLEGLVNASGKMVDSSRTTSVSISHPLQSLDAFQTFAAAHSVEMLSGSDETASNLMGPGRTLGNFLSNAGRRLQVALGSTAERLGKGPSAAMDRIVSLTDELERARNNKLYPAGSSELLRSGMVVKLDLERGPRSFISPPRASDVLVSHLIRYFSHDLSEDLTKNTKFVDSCRRLVAYLRFVPNLTLELNFRSDPLTQTPQTKHSIPWFVLHVGHNNCLPLLPRSLPISRGQSRVRRLSQLLPFPPPK